ncbi:RNA repair transcriptional activator RtcR family protein [Hymenobacter sp. IS2118]|uniref:RNA repair transcriptional activator RtcR family protein n=1 Tax=Hymenobacter sp. IS2118 TaxID=1505605 RepID=UPI00068AB602|nr:RNA repair transcriptional activator RtcR family protein [Hymenobacter sp. IS2118]
MAHLLVSWLARNNDFHYKEGGGFQSINTDGPNTQFHQHFFADGGFDEHILLYADPKQELAAEHLANSLRRQHPRRVIHIELLALNNVIDLAEVKAKVETWLLHRRQHEFTLYFSPGTSIMQLVWYVCHTSLGLNTHLVQTQPGKFSRDGLPVLSRFEVERSTTPFTAIIREEQVAARTARESSGVMAELAPEAVLPASSPVVARKSSRKGVVQPVQNEDNSFLALPSLAKAYRRAAQVAQTDRVTVLVRGESGTGKEHLAQAVHKQSSRSKGRFLAINCAALTDTVLESRLFGYQKGAFTGADQDTKGLFELANDGTIFLDEIGDISPAVQTSLLRVLQEGEIQPLGGTPRKVDVRVVAATHCDLETRCREGKFRWDLYYRLAVAELELPPLRDRPAAEREQLLDYFIRIKKDYLRQEALLVLSAAARKQLMSYPFPGNVRELENLIETLYVFQEPGQAVEPADLPKRIRSGGASLGMSLRMADVSREHIVRVVSQCQGVKRQAAVLLDLDERVVAKAIREQAELETGLAAH